MMKKQVAQQEHLSAIVRRFTNRRVVVVGDLIADQFLYGEISRVSREAPVMILRHERTETVPGGAANCAMNLAALGAHTTLIGTAGEDEAGRHMLNKLHEAGIDLSGVIASPEFPTTTKVRILAGQAHSTRQQVIRVDYESTSPIDATQRARLRAQLREAVAATDAVIVSDYNYDVVDAEMSEALRVAIRDRRVPVLVDSRFRLAHFPGFTSATPNEDEVEHLLGRRLSSASELEAAAVELRARLGYTALLVTRGSQGMLLLEAGADPLHIKAVGSDVPVDVTGAGDTVIATYALALASEASFADAAHIANDAGSIVVMKRGTASVSAQELLASMLNKRDKVTSG